MLLEQCRHGFVRLRCAEDVDRAEVCSIGLVEELTERLRMSMIAEWVADEDRVDAGDVRSLTACTGLVVVSSGCFERLISQ